MVTQDEAASILGVHPSTVWRMIGRGDLTPAVPRKTAQLDRTRRLAAIMAAVLISDRAI